MATKKNPTLDLAVSFGSVSFAKSARVGISMLREDLVLSKADNVLCGRRLTGRLVAVPRGENPDQGHLDGMDGEKFELKGIFDVKRIGITPDELSFGLTFNLEGLDRETISNFAGRSGRLIIEDSEELPADSGDDDED